jgi:nucleoside-diphosphate-sugar epimerase
MKIFLTGATGYIGGSVAVRLLREGHAITGLVRSESGARKSSRGMRAVLGSLDDAEVIARAAREADAVIDTAEANHAGVVETIASALRGSGKPFLHTSGSGIVATVTNGERSDSIYDEYSSFTPAIPRMQRGPQSTRSCSMRRSRACVRR